MSSFVLSAGRGKSWRMLYFIKLCEIHRRNSAPTKMVAIVSRTDSYLTSRSFRALKNVLFRPKLHSRPLIVLGSDTRNRIEIECCRATELQHSVIVLCVGPTDQLD